MQKKWRFIRVFALFAIVAVAENPARAGDATEVYLNDFAQAGKSLRADLLSMESQSKSISKTAVERLSTKEEYAQKLCLYELIRSVGPAHLAAMAKEKDGKAFLKTFLHDPEWVWMFLGSGPPGADPARDLRCLFHLWKNDHGCATNRDDKTLATAVALEYGRKNWPEDRARNRYLFYRDSQRARRLHPIYDSLATWEKRWLTGHSINMHGGEKSQLWLRDNVKLPVKGYIGACWQLHYRSFNYFGDTVRSWKYYYPFDGSFNSFTEMT